MGTDIRLLRIRLGLNLRELAQLCDISRGHLNRIELGQRNATIEILHRLDTAASQFGVESHLAMSAAYGDETAAMIARYMLNPAISEGRKSSVRRMVRTLITVE